MAKQVPYVGSASLPADIQLTLQRGVLYSQPSVRKLLHPEFPVAARRVHDG
jgi:hypothetical protein